MENDQIDYLENEVKRLGNLVHQKEKQIEQMDSTIGILQSRYTNDLDVSHIVDVTKHREYIAVQSSLKEANAEIIQLKKTNYSINDELIKLRTDS